ncbi:MAG: hypothetical protein A2539_08675 [Elusimicrobia bacterium RIFOXYD2_FULL_34_15]|nr:MAG: hypothetical protein A2539_08675 [Elusimicrobia bacterium RIFOXYD2_FULL_34_15]
MVVFYTNKTTLSRIILHWHCKSIPVIPILLFLEYGGVVPVFAHKIIRCDPFFSKVFPNTAAAVATTIEIKVATIDTAIKPAGSSSALPLKDTLMYIAAIIIKTLSTIAQYFIFLKAFTELNENILFCPIYPSNLND